MTIPEHFDSGVQLRIFILECAIRDRFNYLDAIRGCGKEWDSTREETTAEIREMKKRRNRLVREYNEE